MQYLRLVDTRSYWLQQAANMKKVKVIQQAIIVQDVSYNIYHMIQSFNFFTNDKIWTGRNWKHFADDNSNGAKMMISLFNRVENTAGKGENAGFQHFLLFPQCFPMPSSLESGLCGKE